MLEKIIRKLASLELHNNKAKVQLVLHTSVLRFPHEQTKKLFKLCCEAGLDILLPAAYFYEIRELMNSDLFGKKAEAFLMSLKEAKVQLIEKGFEDFYSSDPWADGDANDDCIEEEVFSKNTEKNTENDLYCFLCDDLIKLDEFLRFVYKSDYHMVILPPQVYGEYKLVSINEAKAWDGVQMKTCEYGMQLTPEEFAKKIKQEFFAGGPYIKVCDRINGGGEGELFTYKKAKGKVEKDSLAKLFIHNVSEERKEKLNRLCELSKFFPNVCTIQELLLEKGSSDNIQGIIVEKLEGATFADYLNKDTAELEAWDGESVLRTLLRVLLELNLCEIYVTDIDLSNFMIDRNNVLKLLDFDGVQYREYSSGTLPKRDYVHPLHNRNIKLGEVRFYPIFQHYSVLVLFIRYMMLGNQYIPDDISSLRRQDGIWQTGDRHIADKDCEAVWEEFCTIPNNNEVKLTAEEQREVRSKEKARTVFEAVFCKGKHVSLGDMLEIMEA